jgi:hypothetical protein
MGSYGDRDWLSEQGGLQELHFPKLHVGDIINDCLFAKVA